VADGGDKADGSSLSRAVLYKVSCPPLERFDAVVGSVVLTAMKGHEYTEVRLVP
jgi:hypothetical protein